MTKRGMAVRWKVRRCKDGFLAVTTIGDNEIILGPEPTKAKAKAVAKAKAKDVHTQYHVHE